MIMDDQQKTLGNLIDPKHPLMETFRKTAGGTYKHSQDVSQLCEAVALELGLDNDLLKVAAMYHDIGKINFPAAFSENQNGSNMHDDLDPSVSYHIITKHISDSVLIMVQIEEMPIEVIQWVSQHHGNTVLRYFADKAGDIESDEYRYKCSQPQSIEAAILMICDSVEATVRSLSKSNKVESNESIVQNTFYRLEMDGQLDNIKVGQIRKIREVLISELDSDTHRREVYPEDRNEPEETKEKK
jgi:hypothetical protein